MAGFGVVGVTAAVVLLMVAEAAAQSSFDAGLTSTRCNIDRTKGDIHNPCANLYNAICVGSYCQCPPGEVMDPTTKVCRLGDDRAHSATQRGPVGQFDDLPFDYVPPGQNTTTRPGGQVPPSVSGDVTSIRCSSPSDPSCRTMYGAVCDGSHCMCPVGTHNHPTLAKCEAAPTGSRRGTFDNNGGGDHRGHGQDERNWSNSGTSTVTGGVLVLPVLAAFRLWRA